MMADAPNNWPITVAGDTAAPQPNVRTTEASATTGKWAFSMTKSTMTSGFVADLLKNPTFLIGVQLLATPSARNPTKSDVVVEALCQDQDNIFVLARGGPKPELPGDSTENKVAVFADFSAAPEKTAVAWAGIVTLNQDLDTCPLSLYANPSRMRFKQGQLVSRNKYIIDDLFSLYPCDFEFPIAIPEDEGPEYLRQVKELVANEDNDQLVSMCVPDLEARVLFELPNFRRRFSISQDANDILILVVYVSTDLEFVLRTSKGDLK
jgi:hypothetical protein